MQCNAYVWDIMAKLGLYGVDCSEEKDGYYGDSTCFD